MGRSRKDHKNTKCCICGNKESHIKYIDSNGNNVYRWYLCRCHSIGCTGYMCENCYNKYRYNNQDGNKYDLKLMKNCRTGNLKKDSYTGKGIIGEAIFIKSRKIKSYNIEIDNLNSNFDCIDQEYGFVNVKFREPLYYGWYISFGKVHNFDTLLILCANKYIKDIVNIYAIPEKEIYNITSITIPHNDGGSKWKKFRLKNIDIYNETCHSLMDFLAGKEYFGLEDIKKWLGGS